MNSSAQSLDLRSWITGLCGPDGPVLLAVRGVGWVEVDWWVESGWCHVMGAWCGFLMYSCPQQAHVLMNFEGQNFSLLCSFKMPWCPQGRQHSTLCNHRWLNGKGEAGATERGTLLGSSEESHFLRHLWVLKKWGWDGIWDGQGVGGEEQGKEEEGKEAQSGLLSLYFTWKQVHGKKRRPGEGGKGSAVQRLFSPSKMGLLSLYSPCSQDRRYFSGTCFLGQCCRVDAHVSWKISWLFFWDWDYFLRLFLFLLKLPS